MQCWLHGNFPEVKVSEAVLMLATKEKSFGNWYNIDNYFLTRRHISNLYVRRTLLNWNAKADGDLLRKLFSALGMTALLK